MSAHMSITRRFKSSTYETFVWKTRCCIVPQILYSTGFRSGLFNGHRSGEISASNLWTRQHISRGSVATHLRCGGLFNDNFITSLLLSLLVKIFWKIVSITDQSIVASFLTHNDSTLLAQRNKTVSENYLVCTSAWLQAIAARFRFDGDI